MIFTHILRNTWQIRGRGPPASWRQRSGVDWPRQARPTYQELFHHRGTDQSQRTKFNLNAHNNKRVSPWQQQTCRLERSAGDTNNLANLIKKEPCRDNIVIWNTNHETRTAVNKAVNGGYWFYHYNTARLWSVLHSRGLQLTPVHTNTPPLPPSEQVIPDHAAHCIT